MIHPRYRRMRAAAPAMMAALEEIARIAWHSESEGKPDLPHVDRWRIVNLAREAFTRAAGEPTPIAKAERGRK